MRHHQPISTGAGMATLGDLLSAIAHLTRALLEKPVLPEGLARGFFLKRRHLLSLVFLFLCPLWDPFSITSSVAQPQATYHYGERSGVTTRRQELISLQSAPTSASPSSLHNGFQHLLSGHCEVYMRKVSLKQPAWSLAPHRPSCKVAFLPASLTL